jgi:protein SCO1/2
MMNGRIKRRNIMWRSKANFLFSAVAAIVMGVVFGFFPENGGSVPVAAPAATVLKAPESVPAPQAMAGVPVGGAFALTDHNGNAVTEKSWPGKYKLVFFGFTSCPDTCPAVLQKIAAVMENFDAAGERLVPLFITVDPARDTKDVMAKYVAGFNPHIIGLTGTEAQVKAAEEAYKVYATKVPGPSAHHYMNDHSAYIYLMSPDDQLLEAFSADETAKNMIVKIKADSVK